MQRTCRGQSTACKPLTGRMTCTLTRVHATWDLDLTMTMMTALSLLSPWALHPARLHHRGGQVACSHWSLHKFPHEWQHGMHVPTVL